MAEKYELNINFSDDKSSDNLKEIKTSNDRTSGIFARPRTRNRKFSMDLFDGLKDKLGDTAYNKVLNKTGDINSANRAKFAAGYGINVFTDITADLVKTTANNIGTFTSNEATQNMVDNVSGIMSEGLSAIGTIGAGAAMGGPAGAIAATALVGAKKAIQIATEAIKQAKENVKRNEDSNRIRNRLGYIESGYSR